MAVPAKRPRTKLVCTIGPASVDRARELVDGGMSVARVNFSHGTPDEQRAAVHAVRSAAHHARRSVAVMVDLPGPKIRLGELPGGELELEVGETFELRTNRPTLAQEVQPGDRILLADGAVELTVVGSADSAAADALAMAAQSDTQSAASETDTETPAAETDTEAAAEADAETAATGTESNRQSPAAAPDAEPAAAPGAEPAAAPASDSVVTEVVRGGVVRSRAGVNIPTERLSAEGLTHEDRVAVPRALELRVDLVAQSFVRSADDVRTLRELLPRPGPLLVAKIETRAAVADFDSILDVADGVMIARGDLGADLPYAAVPLVQKDLLRRALARGRFTIVATQMLESMTVARRPTRAEASDVANAVLDGTDAVMLSGETAIGAYPVEAAQAMIEICAATEDGASSRALTVPLADPPSDEPEAICSAAVALADAYPATTAIWCFTRTGRTAELLSVLRPRVPIVAFTLSAVAARRVAVRSGVVPIVIPAGKKSESLADQMRSVARAQHLPGSAGRSTVVLVTTSARPGGINRLELHAVE